MTAAARVALGTPLRVPTPLLAAAAAGVAGGLVLLLAHATTTIDAASALRLGALTLVLAAAVEDVRSRRIPNVLVAPAAVLALLGAPEATPALAGALVAPLPFLAIALLAPAAMGMGDIKLASVAGALGGLAGLLELWLAVSLAGGAIGFLALVRGGRGATIPYGPALAAGALLAVA